MTNDQKNMNYKALFDQSPDAMLLVEDNAIVDCNAASICLFGYTSRSELLSISISVISPEYQSDGQSSTVKFSHIISHAFEQGSISFDWTYINANGHPFFTRVSLVSVTAGSKKLLHFIINDISRDEEDESSILDTNKKLVEAQRIAKMGSWSLDLVKNKLSWSEEIFKLFEINSAQFDASYQSFIDAIHPDDREMVDKAYTDSLKSRKPYQITHRLLFSDGRIKHVREACESSFDINGNPLNSQGTVQDITEQVETDNKISLYASVFKHSPDAILITNPQNKIIAINPALIQLTGYSEDELLGQNPRMLACDRTSHEVYEEMWRSINEHDHWRGELFDKRKDGVIYPKWLSISTIRDSSNEIINYVATFSDITDKKNAEEKIKRLAHHDTLTGLHNRFSLEERLAQAVAQSARSKQKLAVLFIDMDRFKAINDSLGHQAGDDVLIQIAKRLGICIRRESDIIARLGGDEFVVVLTELEDVTAAALIATTIIYTLSQSYVYGHHELHTSPSIGISVFPLDGNTPEELLKHSDIAMYHAKEKGRNNYQFYTESMNAEVKEILVLENDLRSAIQKNQLELYYQPQIQTDNNMICGVEALLRWKHPTRGFIPPDKFIPIAEDSGQILDLGTWVLDKACAQLSEWLAQGIEKVHIAVNVSAHQLKSKNFVKAVKATLEKYQLSANQLELEITETVAMENPEFAIEQLVLLHEIGVLLSIDDFGTGYSSLAYLKMFPIQTLKLDRTFVKNIGEGENDEAICAATISLSHSLGLKVVAEGVETVEQQQFLQLRNCDILQGYLFSRPLPVNEVTDFIKSYNAKK